MPLDPEQKPREFLTVLVAAGLLIFGNKPWSIEQCFDNAERFMGEAEKRVGRLNP
jgi:hypothetical protein